MLSAEQGRIYSSSLNVFDLVLPWKENPQSPIPYLRYTGLSLKNKCSLLKSGIDKSGAILYINRFPYQIFQSDFFPITFP